MREEISEGVREGRGEEESGKRKDKEEIGEVVRGGSMREEISEGVREVRGEEGDKNRSALHKRVKEDNEKEWKDKREKYWGGN